MEKAIVVISDVHAYLDENGTAWLNAEDVARGLGFTRIAESGNEVVRWERVNGYLNDFGFVPTSGHGVRAGDFIPENMFYRLAMKAKNETAEKFQAKVADEILPSIRKTGEYKANQESVAPAQKELADVILDIGKVRDAIQNVFSGVKEGIAIAKALNIVGKFYRQDLSELKELLPPAEHETGYMNATQLGEKVGKSARTTNKWLADNGYQFRDGRDWRLTDKGKQYAEELPYSNNGHSGYQIKWASQIVTFLLEDSIQ